jgi:hypothetical protein
MSNGHHGLMPSAVINTMCNRGPGNDKGLNNQLDKVSTGSNINLVK